MRACIAEEDAGGESKEEQKSSAVVASLEAVVQTEALIAFVSAGDYELERVTALYNGKIELDTPLGDELQHSTRACEFLAGASEHVLYDGGEVSFGKICVLSAVEAHDDRPLKRVVSVISGSPLEPMESVLISCDGAGNRLRNALLTDQPLRSVAIVASFTGFSRADIFEIKAMREILFTFHEAQRNSHGISDDRIARMQADLERIRVDYAEDDVEVGELAPMSAPTYKPHLTRFKTIDSVESEVG